MKLDTDLILVWVDHTDIEDSFSEFIFNKDSDNLSEAERFLAYLDMMPQGTFNLTVKKYEQIKKEILT